MICCFGSRNANIMVYRLKTSITRVDNHLIPSNITVETIQPRGVSKRKHRARNQHSTTNLSTNKRLEPCSSPQLNDEVCKWKGASRLLTTSKWFRTSHQTITTKDWIAYILKITTQLSSHKWQCWTMNKAALLYAKQPRQKCKRYACSINDTQEYLRFLMY